MVAKMYSMIIDVPIEKVWTFIEDLDYWAALLPGYLHHERLNQQTSEWEVRVDIGPIKKKIGFRLEILSMNSPSSMTFQIDGNNEGFTGHGSIEAKKLKRDRTFISANIDLQSTGTFAKIMKPLLKSNPPQLTKEFKEEVSEKILAHKN